MEQVAKKEPSDFAVGSIVIPEEKGSLEEVNFITKEELPALVLQMQLDIFGLKLEEDEYKLGNLKTQLKNLEESIVPTITLQQERDTQNQICNVKEEIRKFEIAISDNTPDLKIARLPQERRDQLCTKRFFLRSLGFLPALGALIWNILDIVFTGFGAGNVGAFLIPVLLGVVGGFLAFEDFSFQLYLNPAKFFKQPDPKVIAQNPTEMNKLSHEWLIKVGLRRIEQAIERFGQLAGEWDNKSAELQALFEQAEKDKNEEAKEKVDWHIKRLAELKAKLQDRLATLQKSREQLLSLKTYDMKLMEIESEIKEFSRDIEGFLSQTTGLLKKIRDTVNLALSAEVDSLIQEKFDPDFNQLQKMIEKQVLAKGLRII